MNDVVIGQPIMANNLRPPDRDPGREQYYTNVANFVEKMRSDHGDPRIRPFRERLETELNKPTTAEAKLRVLASISKRVPAGATTNILKNLRRIIMREDRNGNIGVEPQQQQEQHAEHVQPQLQQQEQHIEQPQLPQDHDHDLEVDQPQLPQAVEHEQQEEHEQQQEHEEQLADQPQPPPEREEQVVQPLQPQEHEEQQQEEVEDQEQPPQQQEQEEEEQQQDEQQQQQQQDELHLQEHVQLQQPQEEEEWPEQQQQQLEPEQQANEHENPAQENQQETPRENPTEHPNVNVDAAANSRASGSGTTIKNGNEEPRSFQNELGSADTIVNDPPTTFQYNSPYVSTNQLAGPSSSSHGKKANPTNHDSVANDFSEFVQNLQDQLDAARAELQEHERLHRLARQDKTCLQFELSDLQHQQHQNQTLINAKRHSRNAEQARREVAELEDALSDARREVNDLENRLVSVKLEAILDKEESDKLLFEVLKLKNEHQVSLKKIRESKDIEISKLESNVTKYKKDVGDERGLRLAAEDELRQLRQEIQTKDQEYQRRSAEEKAIYTKELQDLSKDLDQRLQLTTTYYKDELDKKDLENADLLKSLDEALDELKKLKNAAGAEQLHQTSLKKILESNKVEIEKVQSSLTLEKAFRVAAEREVLRLRAEIQANEAQFQQRILDLQTKHAKELRDLRDGQDQRLDVTTTYYKDELDKKDQEISDLYEALDNLKKSNNATRAVTAPIANPTAGNNAGAAATVLRGPGLPIGQTRVLGAVGRPVPVANAQAVQGQAPLANPTPIVARHNAGATGAVLLNAPPGLRIPHTGALGAVRAPVPAVHTQLLQAAPQVLPIPVPPPMVFCRCFEVATGYYYNGPPVSQCPKHQIVPNRLCYYQFHQQTLGSGTFGSVFCAKVTGFPNHQLAVKVVKADTQQTQTLLYNESCIMDLVSSHPFIPNYYGIIPTASPNVKCMVMDHLPAGSLADIFKLMPLPFCEDHVAHIMAPIILAVGHVHSTGVLHRDVKLGNIVFDASSYAHLIDFGLAVQATKSNLRTGTLVYIAPEVLMEQEYSFGADFWSIGIIIYYLLTRELPFNFAAFGATDYSRIYYMIISTPLSFPTSVRLSTDAQNLVEGLLKTLPNDRLGFTMPPSSSAQFPREIWLNIVHRLDLRTLITVLGSTSSYFRSLVMQVVVNESCLYTAAGASPDSTHNSTVSTDFVTILNMIETYINSYSNILKHLHLSPDLSSMVDEFKLNNLAFTTKGRFPPIWTTPLDSSSNFQMKSQLLTISKNLTQAFHTVSKIPASNWTIHTPIDEDEDEEPQVIHPLQLPPIPNPLSLPLDLIIFYRWFSNDFDKLNKDLHDIMFFARGPEIFPLPQFDPTGQNKFYITLFNETPIRIRELNMATAENEAIWVNNNLFIRAISRIGDSDLSKSLVVYVNVGSGEVYGMLELVEDGLTSFYPLAKSFSQLMLETSTMNASDEDLWDYWVERHVQSE
ncbi:hypothetical protein HDU76_013407 [Blyttiomyces sp. JEL0837]|nr:hypothetical protein HDU76_013407 [Blyttiomyces sp. JEL0837]